MASIQVLRALAALSVVVHHAAYDADTIAGKAGTAPLGLDRVFDFAFGIHLFFVISGFIMVRTARGFGEPGAPWRFLARRLLRIVPLYWLMTSLVLVGAALAPSLLNVPIDGWPLMLGSFLFVPVARSGGEIRPALGQGWTLNYEMVFYLVFAAGMVLRRRAGLAFTAASLVALVLAGRLLSPSSSVLVVWTDGLLLEFLLGVGVGLGLEAGLRLGAWAAWGLGLAGVAAAIALGPALNLSAPPDPWIAGGIPAAMILGAAVWGPPWPGRSAVLLLAILGDASYSLYLTHPFTIRAMRVVWASAPAFPSSTALFLLLSTAAAIVVSLGIYRWVERPITLALHERFPLTARTREGRAAATAERRH